MPALWTISSTSSIPLDNGTLISDKTAITPATDDYILVWDTSDSGNIKKALISDLPGWWWGLTYSQTLSITSLRI